MAGAKQSGLAIAREGNVYTLSWKLPSNGYPSGYNQQICYAFRLSKYNVKTGKWQTQKYKDLKWKYVDLWNTTTAIHITVDPSKYYPNKKSNGTWKDGLMGISFFVRGWKDGWSGWGDGKTFTINQPWYLKSVTQTLSGDQYNVTTFAWTSWASDTDSRPWYDVEMQSMLLKNSSEPDGSKLKWSSRSAVSGTWYTGTSYSRESSTWFTEDPDVINTSPYDSYTRWFRIRARNSWGCSDWRYCKHVYARPNRAYGLTGTSKRDGTGYYVTVRWGLDWAREGSTSYHPIDMVKVIYMIAKPIENLACPSSATEIVAYQMRDTGGYDSATFWVPSLDPDECIYTKIVAWHDYEDNKSESDIVMISGAGVLSAPTIQNASVNLTNHTATIEATNTSEIYGAYLDVLYRTSSDAEWAKAGTLTVSSGTIQISIPSDVTADTSLEVGVRAIATNGKTTLQSSVVSRSVTGANAPMPPTITSVTQSDYSETAKITWTNTWAAATETELSWSTLPYAWQSTDDPDSYVVPSVYGTTETTWYISGLKAGNTYYFRARMIKESDEGTTYTAWSEPSHLLITAEPEVPQLYLSDAVIRQGDGFTAYWSAENQSEAYIYYSADGTNYSLLDTEASAATSRYIDPDTISDWVVETPYLIRVKTMSDSGMSELSYPAQIAIADLPTCTISDISLVEVTGSDVMELTEMPLTATITGAGEGGLTSLTIERYGSCHIQRPDESETDGYDGETIASVLQDGETPFAIDTDNLIGSLDDGTRYRLTATVTDVYGQTATAEQVFDVNWAHQAIMPEGSAVIVNSIAQITPTAPSGSIETDAVDIYRLSADRPELIYAGAEFGTTYVDPYPAIGETGGHRLVYRTANGDYITADNQIAWLDLDDTFESLASIIDFGNDQVLIKYNEDLSYTWSKDFKETKYLGGSVQGDWNPSVSRTGSISTVVLTLEDQDTIDAIRRLAVYPGVCHVRTQDGSSYAADIQVSEKRGYDTAGNLVNFDLSITRVDSEGLDGIPLDQWLPSSEG